jgi:hypothetical protein
MYGCPVKCCTILGFAGVHSTVRHGAAHNHGKKRGVHAAQLTSVIGDFLRGFYFAQSMGNCKVVNEARIYSDPHAVSR